MGTVAETRIPIAGLSFRVLQMDPALASAREAVQAVERFLWRKRSGLAQALEIGGEQGAVVIRSRGEAPQEMIREARELLGVGVDLTPLGEIEVDPAEFTIEVSEPALPEPEPEREILRSTVRYFPLPTCEWYEISSGELSLSDREVAFESEWSMIREEVRGPTDKHVLSLEEVDGCRRGEWWTIPCLLLATGDREYRYGWPAARAELEAIFDVDEWLTHLRTLLSERQ
ncbi:MAG: hypothetical protein ACYS8K_07995 [Planctomycetota bacterium]|jgi:hypothetical protein